MKSYESTLETTISTSSNETINESFICGLFNLQPNQINHISCVGNPKNGQVNVLIKLHPTYPDCPSCGAPSPKIKDYYSRNINHSVLNGFYTNLIYKDRRYQCRCCGKTFFDSNPFIEQGYRHSLLTTKNILEDLRDPNKTMAETARTYNLSPTTIANIFDTHVNITRAKLPKYLCIDEVYAFRSNKSKYVCVLLDYEKKTPIDILPSRHLDDLNAYFSNIPKEERDRVKVFSTDMWKAYRTIAKTWFPTSDIIVDHFHVIQECHKRLDKIRINIQKSFDTSSPEYYLLKKFHWVLFKNDNCLLDVNRKKRYNRKLRQYLNFHDIKCLLQDSHPQLEVAVNLKDALCTFYDTIKIIEQGDDPSYQKNVPALKYNKSTNKPTTRSSKERHRAEKWNAKRVLTKQQALAELDELIQRFRSCELIEFSGFASLLNNWKKEIVNSLCVYNDLNKETVSNALIENRNKIIKNVKRTSNGYSNWRRFRNRLLFTLSPTSTYSLIALDDAMEWKRKKNRENYEKWKKYNAVDKV